MSSLVIAVVVFGCLLAAMLLGMGLRRLLPAHHLSGDSKDAVKLAMGLVATMAALLLGLLVSSAKGSYDTVRGQVIQLAAKVLLADRALEVYGPEAADAGAQLRVVVEQATHQLWPQDQGAATQLAPDVRATDGLYGALQRLSPQTDVQRAAKSQILSVAVDFAQIRSQLVAQAVPSISMPMLIVVVGWLAVIFLSFSLLAPTNLTVLFAFVISALSVTAAIFLILELDHPFAGLIRVSSEPMLHALRQVAQ